MEFGYLRDAMHRLTIIGSLGADGPGWRWQTTLSTIKKAVGVVRIQGDVKQTAVALACSTYCFNHILWVQDDFPTLANDRVGHGCEHSRTGDTEDSVKSASTGADGTTVRVA